MTLSFNTNVKLNCELSESSTGSSHLKTQINYTKNKKLSNPTNFGKNEIFKNDNVIGIIT